jgi:hypothetical protein
MQENARTQDGQAGRFLAAFFENPRLSARFNPRLNRRLALERLEVAAAHR